MIGIAFFLDGGGQQVDCIIVAEALGGRRVVTIAAVPDDEHVTLRRDEGTEVTLALESIREAHLVVDWAAVTRRRGD